MISLPFLASSDVSVLAAFLFIFAIVYAILTYAKVLGSIKHVNIIIALVIAFFSANYSPFVSGMINYMPIASILLVVVFFFMLVRKLFEPKEGQKLDALPISLATGIALIIVGLLWDKIAPSVPGLSSDNILWILGLSAVLIILYAGYRSG